MNTLLVSIIVPCYNQAQFLDEALQSIVEQTYENWECIIVNDGSPDNTEEVAMQWLDKDNRFKYIYKRNGGLSSARNAGLDLAKGQYIQFLDADDCLSFEKIIKSLNTIQSHTERNVVVTNFKLFKENILDNLRCNSNLKQEFLTFQNILFEWDLKFSIPIHCGLFSISLFNDFRFNDQLQAKEDWLMWLHIFQKDIKIFFINKDLVFYRLHKSNMTKDYKHMHQNTLKSFEFLEGVIQEDVYKKYILFRLKDKTKQYEELLEKYRILQNREKIYKNSISFRIEKKICNLFLKKKFK